MKKNRAFTLIELLAVIVIIMILAGILIGGISYASKKADISKTQARLEALQSALEAFKQEYGYYPPCSSEETVRMREDSSQPKLVLGSATFPMHTRANKVLIEFDFSSTAQDYTDAWDNAFKYKCPGTHNPEKYDLRSEGADSGNEDDITNW